MRPVVEAHRDRRVRGRDRVDRRLLIELLVAVPFAAGDPPGGALWHDVEFGDFVGDLRGWQPRLLGQFIAEADAVVEQAETDVHRVPAPAFILTAATEQFVVAVAPAAAVAPRPLPSAPAAHPDERRGGQKG